MVLNLAEGAAEFRPAEKARFFRMARRSANECMAALDLAQTHIRGEDITAMKMELDEIAAMLTSLTKLAEARVR